MRDEGLIMMSVSLKGHKTRTAREGVYSSSISAYRFSSHTSCHIHPDPKQKRKESRSTYFLMDLNIRVEGEGTPVCFRVVRKTVYVTTFV